MVQELYEYKEKNYVIIIYLLTYLLLSVSIIKCNSWVCQFLERDSVITFIFLVKRQLVKGHKRSEQTRKFQFLNFQRHSKLMLINTHLLTFSFSELCRILETLSGNAATVIWSLKTLRQSNQNFLPKILTPYFFTVTSTYTS